MKSAPSVTPGTPGTPTVRQRVVEPQALQYLREAGVPPLPARLLAARGVTSIGQALTRLADLTSYEGMRDIDRAATLLADTIESNQSILVIADYDCDGATACALAVRALRMIGARIDYLVPNRFEHGYGLTEPIVALARTHPRLGCPDLLVTVDNGIASIEGVAAARRLGMRVIVTDHHLPGTTLPEADAIVDPNRRDCPHPGKSLAGVGVMFHVLLALRALWVQRGHIASRSQWPLSNLLDLVALGTVADLARLDHDNRILVAAGLRRLARPDANPGLRALLEVAGRHLPRVTCADLGFALGPRINAAGRMSDITLGIECLLCDDPPRAALLARELDAINRQRKDVELDMREQAMNLLADLPDPAHCVVIHHPDWHEGVVGLVASRLKERYHRPSFALAASSAEPGMLRGSGRSIEGVHLRDALDLVSKRHPGLLARFGGHAMAAGLTLPRAALGVFERAMDEAVATIAAPESFDPFVLVDGPLEADELTLTVCDELESMVWGQGFAAPLFCDDALIVEQSIVGERHLKLRLEVRGILLEGICFGRTEPAPRRSTITYRLSRNDWRGQSRLQLVIDNLS